MASVPQRYHSLAIILHWVMAVAILLMLASGLAVENLGLAPTDKFQLIQAHKSLGVLVLLAGLLRLGVRLATAVPPLPIHFAGWEQRAAKLGHIALYILMLLLPLSGWVMVSASVYGLPTIVFGWFTWPHLPGLAANAEISEAAGEVHEWLAYSLLLVLALHVGAVIKHAVCDHENLLRRLWWGTPKAQGK